MTHEVKVGSLWLEKDTNAIIKVLSICGDADFIQVNDDPNGIALYLDRIAKHFTPYTPPRVFVCQKHFSIVKPPHARAIAVHFRRHCHI